jgi:glutamine amidotransferase
MSITIVDYGMGNLGSIQNMLKKVGSASIVSADKLAIERADKLILPGVGAFDTGMRRLGELGLIPILNRIALEKRVPVLGVCLGMQLLMRKSEEGHLPGLGWIEGEAVRFRFDAAQSNLKIPHMGWNTVSVRRPGVLLKGIESDARFYFVHSYHVVCARDEDVLAVTEYGYPFASIIQHENIMGAQFHPEKSHRFGMAMLKSFVEL